MVGVRKKCCGGSEICFGSRTFNTVLAFFPCHLQGSNQKYALTLVGPGWFLSGPKLARSEKIMNGKGEKMWYLYTEVAPESECGVC